MENEVVPINLDLKWRELSPLFSLTQNQQWIIRILVTNSRMEREVFVLKHTHKALRLTASYIKRLGLSWRISIIGG